MSLRLADTDAAARTRRRHISAERSRARYVETLWATFRDPYASAVARSEAEAVLQSRGLLPAKDP